MPKMGVLVACSRHQHLPGLYWEERRLGSSAQAHPTSLVCGSNYSLSVKMLLAAAKGKPDQTGLHKKETDYLTQQEVSDKRGSGQSFRALGPRVCGYLSPVLLALVSSSLAEMVAAVLCISSRHHTLWRRGGNHLLVFASFSGSPWKTSLCFSGTRLLTCKLVNPSLVLRNVVIMIDWE